MESDNLIGLLMQFDAPESREFRVFFDEFGTSLAPPVCVTLAPPTSLVSEVRQAKEASYSSQLNCLEKLTTP
jgi:hypothetical protein